MNAVTLTGKMMERGNFMRVHNGVILLTSFRSSCI